MDEKPTMRMVEIEYLEWAGKHMAVFESLRTVARAARKMRGYAERSVSTIAFDKALDALPRWVLDE